MISQILKMLSNQFNSLKYRHSNQLIGLGTGTSEDTPDARDLVADENFAVESFSLSAFRPPIKSQSNTNSCVANAFLTAKAQRLRIMGNDRSELDESEMDLWYQGRERLGWQDKNSGMLLRDGAKILTNNGVCLERFNKFNPANYNVAPTMIAKFTRGWGKLRGKPLPQGGRAYYERVLDLEHAKQMVSAGHPVVIASKIYREWFYNQGEVISAKLGTYSGSHALVMDEFDENERTVSLINSWGSNKGSEGIYKVSEQYFKNNVHDMWVVHP